MSNNQPPQPKLQSITSDEEAPLLSIEKPNARNSLNKKKKYENEKETFGDKIKNKIKRKSKKKKRKNKKPKKRKKKEITFWSLMTNTRFLFFSINCVTPIALLVWWWMLRPDASTPYILSGILGIVVCLYGLRHFRQLIALTHEANIFSEQVRRMRREHQKVQKSVDDIIHANKELKATESRLRDANEKNRENLKSFANVQESMKMLDTRDVNIIQEHALKIKHRWHDELLQQERTMLHTIFDRWEMRNDKEGMDKEEFDKFSQSLPTSYRLRFERLGTFEKLANDKDVLEYADFEVVLDLFAEMVVDDVDIEFDVDKEFLEAAIMEVEFTQTLSAISDDTDSNSDDANGGGGFFERLQNWRATRKQEKIRQSANIRRSIKVRSRTPTVSQDFSSMAGFKMFTADIRDNTDSPGNLTPNLQYLSPRISAISINAMDVASSPIPEEEEDDIMFKFDTGKLRMTPSSIENMPELDIDQHSLHDDDINAYMEKLQMNVSAHAQNE